MGRFDPSETPSKSNSEGLGSGAEKLRSTVERQVRDVVEEAMARALTIEDRALSSAMHSVDAMREATETLEGELTKVIASFRDEIEALGAELKTAKKDLAVQPEGTSSSAGDLSARDMVRQQLIRIRAEGKPREEGERYLGRFEQSGDYNDVLNEIFPGPEPVKQRRRGLLRRRQEFRK
jgi:hypothetical protein